MRGFIGLLINGLNVVVEVVMEVIAGHRRGDAVMDVAAASCDVAQADVGVGNDLTLIFPILACTYAELCRHPGTVGGLESYSSLPDKGQVIKAVRSGGTDAK